MEDSYSVENIKRLCVFDRSLVEAVQGIALSSSSVGTSSCHLLNLSVFRHVLTYLRIVSIRIILILNKIRQVLRIVSNRIKSIMTCLDMFENHIKSHHKHYDMSGHVWESYQIASKVLWPYFQTSLNLF